MTVPPVVVLFVGGTEVQARYVKQIERSVMTRHHGTVRVEWFLTGWTGNWIDDAKRIEGRLSGASAMVLMSFVRTMLGRRLRRAAGRAQVPWVACTGHGRAAIEDAIDRAVVLADRVDSTAPTNATSGATSTSAPPSASTPPPTSASPSTSAAGVVRGAAGTSPRPPRRR